MVATSQTRRNSNLWPTTTVFHIDESMRTVFKKLRLLLIEQKALTTRKSPTMPIENGLTHMGCNSLVVQCVSGVFEHLQPALEDRTIAPS